MNFLKRKHRDARRGGWKTTGQNVLVNNTSAGARSWQQKQSRSEHSTHSVYLKAKEQSSLRCTFLALHRELATKFSLRIMGLYCSFQHVPWKFSMHAFKLTLKNQLPGKLTPRPSFLSTVTHGTLTCVCHGHVWHRGHR